MRVQRFQERHVALLVYPKQVSRRNDLASLGEAYCWMVWQSNASAPMVFRMVTR